MARAQALVKLPGRASKAAAKGSRKERRETKTVQFHKAITEALEATRARRELMYKFYKQYITKAEPTELTLKDQITAAFFAQEVVNLEAKTSCACLLVYSQLFKAETRTNSPRLDPIREALRAAGFFHNYDCTLSNASLDCGKFGVYCYIHVGPSNGRYYNTLSADDLAEELKRLEAKCSSLSPAEIISKAEATANAWEMLQQFKARYSNNSLALRKMFGDINCNDWKREMTPDVGY